MKVRELLDLCMCHQCVRIIDNSRTSRINALYHGDVLGAITQHKDLMDKEIDLIALRTDILEIHTTFSH